MRISALATIATIFLSQFVNAQQTSLYDSDGSAIAYIDYSEDATIYLWNGTPVAFRDSDGVIGFNGKFLGWYDDGIMYDKNGYVVGATAESLNTMTEMEPMKGMQKMTPMRPMSPMAPMQPMLNNSWSSSSLSEFLYSGKR